MLAIIPPMSSQGNLCDGATFTPCGQWNELKPHGRVVAYASAWFPTRPQLEIHIS
jgi:hypothetical protein